MDIPAWREENLAKNLVENGKKIDVEPSSNWREREKLTQNFKSNFD